MEKFFVKMFFFTFFFCFGLKEKGNLTDNTKFTIFGWNIVKPTPKTVEKEGGKNCCQNRQKFFRWFDFCFFLVFCFVLFCFVLFYFVLFCFLRTNGLFISLDNKVPFEKKILTTTTKKNISMFLLSVDA